MFALGQFPTRISSIVADGAPILIKHEDESSALYAGNKVRKLERIFADARACGRDTLLTVGAAGSHHVLATAAHGRACGFRVEAVLVPQPHTQHAERNLRAGLAQGLHVHAARNYVEAAFLLARHRVRRAVFYVPMGGSSLHGAASYMQAAREFVAQAPTLTSGRYLHVVAVGSAGTAAGLAVGLAQHDPFAVVHAVAIGAPLWLIRRNLRALCSGLQATTARGVGLARVQPVFVSDQLGPGYGVATSAGASAIRTGAEYGLYLDPTYTAKAFAHALDLARAQPLDRVVFWQTLASPRATALQGEFAVLPSHCARLLV